VQNARTDSKLVLLFCLYKYEKSYWSSGGHTKVKSTEISFSKLRTKMKSDIPKRTPLIKLKKKRFIMV
jgi:hypothetical protein